MTAARVRLHLVRRAPPPAALAPGDWIARATADGWTLDDHGAPPLPPGPIDAGQLHDLIFAAALVVAW